MTIIIDTPERITHSFGIADELTGTHGLVTCETVPALMALDGDEYHGSTDLSDYH
jgi:PII-like signaling protein